MFIFIHTLFLFNTPSACVDLRYVTTNLYSKSTLKNAINLKKSIKNSAHDVLCSS